MKDADNGRDLYAGTGDRDILDVDRADPFAARFDDILLAVGNAHEAIRIDCRDIAGVEPAIFVERGGFLAIVALEHPGSADHDGAGASTIVRQLPAIVVDDLELDAELEPALTRPDDFVHLLVAERRNFR